MPVWRLIPIDPLDPNWEASSHRGPVVVRAPDEKVAREVAAAAFDVPVHFTPGEGIKAPPWKRAQSVRVELLERSIYEIEGPNEVLDPSFDSDLQGPGTGFSGAGRRPMTASIPEFQRHVEESMAWVTDLQARLEWEQAPLAHLALRATLHALREHLGGDAAVYLGVELPTLLRGEFFEAWHPRKPRPRSHDRQGFLDWIREGVRQNPGIDPELVARKVLELLTERLAAAELEQLRAATPRPLEGLWPE